VPFVPGSTNSRWLVKQGLVLSVPGLIEAGASGGLERARFRARGSATGAWGGASPDSALWGDTPSLSTVILTSGFRGSRPYEALAVAPGKYLLKNVKYINLRIKNNIIPFPLALVVL
jgi:hypothetical protein